jgi:DNA polymerase III delta subunit
MAARTREPDPPTQLRGLERALKQGLPRGVLVRGEETYFRSRCLDLALGAAREAGLEVCRHDLSDPEFSLPALLDDLGGSPMFASARCIVVRNADATVRRKSLLAKEGRKDSALTRALVGFLSGDREGCAVVDAKGLRADHAVAKAVKAAGGPVVSCRRLWDTPPPWDPDPRKSELAQWTGQRASELGLRLSVDEATYVALATGNDLTAIETQLEKVRRGGRERLRELVGWDSGGSPWKAADEVLGGQLRRSLAAVEALFRAGFHSDRDGRTEVDPRALTAMVLGSMRGKARQALLLSRALAGGSSPAAALEAAGARGEAAGKALAALASQRDPRAWERVYGEVLDLERRSRTGATVGADDLVRLALACRVEPAQDRGRAQAPARPRGGR